MKTGRVTYDKRSQIASELLAEMRAGLYAAGQRLPTRAALEARYQVSSITIQHALDQLRHDGFVRTAGRHGTFVAEFAPHVAHYGLVLPVTPGAGGSLFYEAIHHSFRALLPADAGARLVVYSNVGRVTNLGEYQRLTADVLGHRLAGLVIAGPGHDFLDTPILTHPGLRRITLSDTALAPEVTTQRLDRADWTQRLVQRLTTLGRRRVALFLATRLTILDRQWDHLRRQLVAAGMELRDEWILPAPLGARELARNTALLLLRQPADARPDAIVILDDNVVAGITDGIACAGLPLAAQPAVIAQCNFPCPPPHAVPVTWLGYDFRQFARQALTCIDACTAGQPPPPSLPPLPAVEQED